MEPKPEHIRNFAVVGHASSGKTMVCEAMLLCTGATSRLGTIAEGTTVSDYHQGEKDRQISIHSSVLHTTWMDRKLNLIDTPGYQDFISEALGALRVGDFALIVVHAKHGVGAGTDQVWDYATSYGIPKVVVVNALDKESADFDQVLSEIRHHFGEKIFPMGVPINPGPGFNRILDVLRSEIVQYHDDKSGRFVEEPASGPWKDKVRELHKELIEHVAESDDELMQKFFDQDGLTEEELRAGVHAALQRQTFIPVFCTSAENNVGVSRLVDFIAKYGSSPADRGKVHALDAQGQDIEVRLADAEPSCYIFKTMSEAQFGELSFFRLYSGRVRSGTELYNSDRKIRERIGQLYILNGRERRMVSELGAGDIGAVVKLKDTHTGNTLCSAERPVTLPRVEYPRPNIYGALKFNARGEEDKVAEGLATLREEDPTFLYRVDSELHQTLIEAQGALHLEVLLERLKRRFKVNVELVPPRIPFRETVTRPADARYRHKKQTGGAGQFAEVWLRITPAARGTGIEFMQSLSGQNVDRGFVPSVEKGVHHCCQEGVLAGYRIVDVRVDFYDGKQHPVDSKDIAFQTAGFFAFKEAFEKAAPRLLEPIQLLEIRVPTDAMGKVINDLSSRRGRILQMDAEGLFQRIQAEAPAAELYQYATQLRSLTGGRGLHAEKLSHYAEMPESAQQELIEDYRRQRAKGD